MSVDTDFLDDDYEHTIQNSIATLAPAVAKMARENVTLKIDGHEVTVPPVVIETDSQGEFVRDEQGNAKYRYTTIYDAASRFHDGKMHEKSGSVSDMSDCIPILCHREHMRPAAVCRVCLVEIHAARPGDTKLAPEGKLAAACHRKVDNGIEVFTIRKSKRVQAAVGMITELLLSDNPKPKEPSTTNELHQLPVWLSARGVKVHQPPRFPNELANRLKDLSSQVIAVDHSACILCDRCVRACNEVRDYQVIGRAGKGYQAHIAFDLDDPMGNSSCVSCGECAISCPTSALTCVTAVEVDLKQSGAKPVATKELLQHELFRGVSPQFLERNRGAVVRRKFRRGDVVCKEGEYGATAFIIENGRFEVAVRTQRGHVEKKKSGGFAGFASRLLSGLRTRNRRDADPEDMSTTRFVLVEGTAVDVGSPETEENRRIAVLTEDDLIFGEMTCMNNYPRSATITALGGDCEALEINRNVLYMIQRNSASRKLLDKLYRDRAITPHLRSVPIFSDLASMPAQHMVSEGQSMYNMSLAEIDVPESTRLDELVDFLRRRVELLRVQPGQTIVRQGDKADAFYMVKVGFIKVSQSGPGGDFVRSYVGPGNYFGEMGLLPPEAGEDPEQFGVRNATCSAIDHVEIVKLPKQAFLEMCEEFPEVRDRIRKSVRERQKINDKNLWDTHHASLDDFIGQGLYNAQSLLVLDLEKCTRCDECTRACADAHYEPKLGYGVTRLIRDGLRYDKFLVASSCRSCQDPFCMIGCPVGAIRRQSSLEIVIEDWCIGCGLCSNNCPYGNINMHPFPRLDEKGREVFDEQTKKPVLQMKATMCDLCSKTEKKEPSCVYACPHDAAHRMNGRQLWETVNLKGR